MNPTPPVTPIADDIFQVRLPLPFALNHINTYLVRDDVGWTLVDTGLNHPASRATWKVAFDQLKLSPAQIRRIILTHHHPDHFGMAGWFQSQGAGLVYMSPRERELALLVWQEYSEQDFDSYMAAYGMPQELVATVAHGMSSTAAMTHPHPPFIGVIEPGSTITIGERRFKALLAPGHSDGQMILYDAHDKLMLSGDHILMKITPNIGLWPDTQPDPLGRFMESLRSLLTYDVRLGLPGHRAVITDWRGRIVELLEHHELRLGHTLAAVADGSTVYAASLKVFNSQTFTPHEWRFAMAETLAHLAFLEKRGLVRRETTGEAILFCPVG